jgi:glycosyltransferase involved in cell wall biosynthesis
MEANCGQIGGESPAEIELSVVMPCLNEADTVAACIKKARAAIEPLGDQAEIIIADNGSTDGSQQIAAELGARVVHVSEKGYGSALMEGIAAARGRFVIMGDADESYDFGEIPKFLKKLREGYDIVQGCRLPSGGGRVAPGAMPFIHRWWGNPMFSALATWWFGAPVHDVYCGMRGFRRDWYRRIDQRCIGMEFATEMIIKSSLYKGRFSEVPITLHPDGRKAHAPHLKTFRDGWRTLRFFLLYSPRWLFLIPGAILIALGLVGYSLAMPGVTVLGAHLDAHTLLFSSLALIVGYQSIFFAIFTKVFAVSEHLLPLDPRLERFFNVLTLERGIASGALACLTGAFLLGMAVHIWFRGGFGPLEYGTTMRWVVPGFTLFALGFQTIWSSFFVSILGMRRK